MAQRYDDSTPRYRAETAQRTPYERIENAEAPLVPRAPDDDGGPSRTTSDTLLLEGAE